MSEKEKAPLISSGSFKEAGGSGALRRGTFAGACGRCCGTAARLPAAVFGRKDSDKVREEGSERGGRRGCMEIPGSYKVLSKR